MEKITTAIQTTPSLTQRVRQFVDELIIPNEARLAEEGENAKRFRLSLTEKAQSMGVFGSFYPLEYGGKLSRLVDYISVAEQEGRSEYAPNILGADATLDAYMLHRHASPNVREKFLCPLVEGKAISSYAMSEPDSIGSIPATMRCRATLHNGVWHVSGKKWFVCRAQWASFATVIARTSDSPIKQALSMIVVPTNAPGFEVVRPLSVLGRWQGQTELAFNDVHVPYDHVLGLPGQGIDLMQQRLGLGRLLRSAHWLGQAQRCFDLMCQRIHSPRGQLANLAEKQLARARVYQVYRSIISARGFLLDAARKFDAGISNSIEVNLAKLAASDAISQAADSAIQIMGAEGLSDWTPLDGIYRNAKTTHILDGADDALISAIGRQLLTATAPGMTFDSESPSCHLSGNVE